MDDPIELDQSLNSLNTSIAFDQDAVMIPHGGHFHSAAELSEAGPIMLTVFIVTMLVAQAVIWFWQRKHPQSFDRVALFLVWLIPAVLAYRSDLTLVFYLWMMYSVCAIYILVQAHRQPIDRTTPKLVYTFFELCFKLCYAVASIGYISMIFGVFALLPPFIAPYSLAFLFLGLYFGVLTRDFCAVCQTSFVAKLGLAGSLGQPLNTCALCAQSITQPSISNQLLDQHEPKPIELSCKHSFHEACIRGWTLVGKKDHCPCCREKVPTLTELIGSNPWTKQLIAWKTALDFIRYLLVLNPILLTVTKYVVQIVW